MLADHGNGAEPQNIDDLRILKAELLSELDHLSAGLCAMRRRWCENKDAK